MANLLRFLTSLTTPEIRKQKLLLISLPLHCRLISLPWQPHLLLYPSIHSLPPHFPSFPSHLLIPISLIFGYLGWFNKNTKKYKIEYELQLPKNRSDIVCILCLFYTNAVLKQSLCLY